MLSGVYPSLKPLAGYIQPLIHDIGFCLHALDDSESGGFFRRKAGSPAQTSRLQPGAPPRGDSQSDRLASQSDPHVGSG
jgi:hypothetical protein